MPHLRAIGAACQLQPSVAGPAAGAEENPDWSVYSIAALWTQGPLSEEGDTSHDKAVFLSPPALLSVRPSSALTLGLSMFSTFSWDRSHPYEGACTLGGRFGNDAIRHRQEKFGYLKQIWGSVRWLSRQRHLPPSLLISRI